MSAGMLFAGGRARRGWARLGAAMAVMAVCGVGAAQAEPLKVVASFSILADMVNEVGGDQVQTVALIGPNQDAHSFEPRPGDARKLGEAQLLVVNGLEFETWLPGLVKASGFKGSTAVASAGVKALRNAEDGHDDDDDHDHGHDDDDHDDHGHDDHGHDDQAHGNDSHGHAEDAHGHHHHGEFDPHAWQDVRNGILYARNIERALIAADPEHAEGYRQRANDYVARLQALDGRLREAFGALPQDHRKVVVAHAALDYFGQAYGLVFLPVAGQSTAAEPSAAEMARLIKQIRDEHINAVFIENVSRSRLADQIARETGAQVGGLLFTDALAASGQRGSTYLDMMEWNAQQLLDALKPQS
ncbi:zinc ABC transporter substrate-binding protein [Pseudomonas sp. S 311-6]|uniref:Zinc/manganese transport system substrate-binding protein n=3 Tax=Kerstersia gyiorum TaxID=206506 RepID=A0A4Q7MYX2_9BURK|nr:zinc ABC transporter substrate-binding protein [Kerstersia gyiorum]MCI1228186.1 zinc ABC transporter substrate-binding protein [Kerstersia gyiorum]MCO7635892.1 zinc ABC transporter substrate-binding protein [Pseudomonas sp. S 311-6]MCR4157586.1 zinc ABC transporter substrate-binding protein [Kerstersia gyiorum]RZS73370.1 zinc/manganese transport system substrate-binding protein [Kerstersia gyiorum]